MGALGAVAAMFQRIPPTGNPISWRHPGAPPALVADAQSCLLLNSGTAALAAALILAREATSSPSPEVIMPGYACPDIISAAVHAGVTPVLVDLEPDRPYMSLNEIQGAINENTIAVVALNFLGIPERMTDIRALIDRHNIILIEDSAQWFPDTDTPVSAGFSGDLVVLSFGKGKPVNLLGGGALLIKKTELTRHTKPAPTRELSALSEIKLRAMFPVYNQIISSLAYWLLEALPFINLGATHYKTLDSIWALDDIRRNFLSENIRRYQARSITAQEQIHRIVKGLSDSAVDLPSACPSHAGQRLLRYPLLLPDVATRDKVLNELASAGTGASPFYASALPAIAGVAKLTKSHSTLSHARNFADRLITLPTHSGVTARHIAAFEKTLKTAHKSATIAP